MTMLLLFLMSHQQTDGLLRVIFDVEIQTREKQFTAGLALNKWEDDRFSISCRKMPGGAFFTYWAMPDEDYLLFPRENLAFTGQGSGAFGLFPGGPILTREQWLGLLDGALPNALGDFQVMEEGEWRVMTQSNKAFVIRWKEKTRSYKKVFRPQVLEPRKSKEVQEYALSRFVDFWNGEEAH